MGKFVAAIARTVRPNVDLSSVVVTRCSHPGTTVRITVRDASHPVPDQPGSNAAIENFRVVKRRA
ncbi:DUF4147 domain-containing protein [Paracoccus marcusii]|uniref:DUF4147 domain-containing protein n=1 Tax=Paracoccus marcusii TaxID=59779 RepID=UPI0038620E6C